MRCTGGAEGGRRGGFHVLIPTQISDPKLEFTHSTLTVHSRSTHSTLTAHSERPTELLESCLRPHSYGELQVRLEAVLGALYGVPILGVILRTKTPEAGSPTLHGFDWRIKSSSFSPKSLIFSFTIEDMKT